MNVLDLFSGCGGFSSGFKKAGCNILGFVEWWTPAITTFLKNHPKAIHLGSDITKISDKSIQSLKGRVDIIVGGPPCQGFSLCGKRDPKDKRNKLYKEFLRFVKIIEPKFVVMENVSAILSMEDNKQEKVINKIIHEFISLDYFVSYKVLNSFDYGVAQKRKRLILIAKKIDLFPDKLPCQKTVIEAIHDLPLRENGLNAHILFHPKEETVEKIKNLQQGQKLSNTFNFSRQRLFAFKPSSTVVTKPIYIHPYYHRFLTPRELARLQSFSDDFFFCGSKTDMVKQIGNAVPPLMARCIAKKILEGETK